MNNTFKLKKNHPRVSVPFSGSVITENSKDALVFHYLNQVEAGTEERKRRESFFDVLPTKVEVKKAEPKKKKAEPKKVEVKKEA